MAYSAGDTILDDEYNTFVTGGADGSATHSTANVNTVWGTGDATKGYGQTGDIAAVSAGATITATQWNNFLGRIETLGAHQGTSVTDYSALTTDDTVAALTTVSTDVTNVYNNRYNAAAVGSAISTTSVGTNTWTTTQNTTLTLTFASEAQMNHWFNAGGTVRFSCSRSGGTSNDKNTEWTDMMNDLGTIWISASDSHTVNSQALSGTTKVGGTGSGGGGTVISNNDFYDLTGSLTQMMIFYADTAPYTANYIKLEASKSGAVLTITATFQDDAADTGNPTYPAGGTNPASLDNVNGTLTVSLDAYQPSTSNLTATWGTPSWATTDAL